MFIYAKQLDPFFDYLTFYLFQPSVRKQHNAGYKHKVYITIIFHLSMWMWHPFASDLLITWMVFRRMCEPTTSSLRSNKLKAWLTKGLRNILAKLPLFSRLARPTTNIYWFKGPVFRFCRHPWCHRFLELVLCSLGLDLLFCQDLLLVLQVATISFFLTCVLLKCICLLFCFFFFNVFLFQLKSCWYVCVCVCTCVCVYICIVTIVIPPTSNFCINKLVWNILSACPQKMVNYFWKRNLCSYIYTDTIVIPQTSNFWINKFSLKYLKCMPSQKMVYYFF